MSLFRRALPRTPLGELFEKSSPRPFKNFCTFLRDNIQLIPLHFSVTLPTPRSESFLKKVSQDPSKTFLLFTGIMYNAFFFGFPELCTSRSESFLKKVPRGPSKTFKRTDYYILSVTFLCAPRILTPQLCHCPNSPCKYCISFRGFLRYQI